MKIYGGFASCFGIGDVNAYVEKTIITEEGDIGKIYKYVIWNIYDENKNLADSYRKQFNLLWKHSKKIKLS